MVDQGTADGDLGRGLLTVGGPRSYGAGGYRESPLGDLLPRDRVGIGHVRLLVLRRGLYVGILSALVAG